MNTINKIDIKTMEEGITAVLGIKAAGVHCGLKNGNEDLALIFSKKPAAAAGVFYE